MTRTLLIVGGLLGWLVVGCQWCFAESPRLANRKDAIERMVIMLGVADAGLVVAADSAGLHALATKHSIRDLAGDTIDVQLRARPLSKPKAFVQDTLIRFDLATLRIPSDDAGAWSPRGAEFQVLRRSSLREGERGLRALGHPNGMVWTWADGLSYLGTSEGTISFDWGSKRPETVAGFSGGVLVDNEYRLVGVIYQDEGHGSAYDVKAVRNALGRKVPYTLFTYPEGDRLGWASGLLVAGCAITALAMNNKIGSINDDLSQMPTTNRAEIDAFNNRVDDGRGAVRLRDGFVNGAIASLVGGVAWEVNRWLYHRRAIRFAEPSRRMVRAAPSRRDE